MAASRGTWVPYRILALKAQGWRIAAERIERLGRHPGNHVIWPSGYALGTLTGILHRERVCPFDDDSIPHVESKAK